MKSIFFFLLAATCITGVSCRKSFLDAKPDAALVVPTSLEDLQAILDNDRVMNGSVAQSTGGPNPALLAAGGDEYYTLDANFNNFLLYSKNVYTWEREDVYGGVAQVPDWSIPYRAVYYANVVLDGLQKIPSNDHRQAVWKSLQGSALFFRAHTFYQLAQVFAPAYTGQNGGTAPGIPLRLNSDINEPITRSTLSETYAQILGDLKTASGLLPLSPLYATRPSKPASLALLSRVYLSMEQYDSAFVYADSCLRLKSTLFDYNNAVSSQSYPLSRNPEVLFACIVNTLPSTELLSATRARVDSTLYQSYAANDLRRTLFFMLREPGRYSFRGGYEPNGFLFTGLATDEQYLVRAECYARKGAKQAALNDLNTLLQKRWKTGSFVPFTAPDADDALRQVLTERKKQLLLRGLRWTDLRRLNRDPRFSKPLTRIVNGTTFVLPPNDPRYTWPIPPDVIGFYPSMPQNPR